MDRDFREEFSHLTYFVEAYLHQDWGIEGGSIEEVMRSKRELAPVVPGIRSDAEKLLAESLSERALEDIFENTWGSGYEPGDATDGSWADALREIIDASLSVESTENT
ncbi:contact-dependent growth inhibition system immunity protein [Actinorugispora endophytica]|uniref:CdiI immunity protein domain-containing protein n=1 Tax=Actinorugispora endophytica TaxID=1605990 RepID=A0A4R6V187_9ACTN|nr:contact-dependent growth inhibition system immunity protein [Actinorugispora endophytica]TDQ53751.1 hypothetical protein EV190_103202 [Actinorugispora endophytica]